MDEGGVGAKPVDTLSFLAFGGGGVATGIDDAGNATAGATMVLRTLEGYETFKILG